MPALKSLAQHVHDGSFRSRRHHELLAGTVVPWPELATLQGRYLAAAHPLEKRAIGVEFETVARTIPKTERVDEDDPLNAIFNMPLEDLNPARDRAASERAYRVLYARDAHLYGMARAGEEHQPLSVKEIAVRLGVSRSTVSRYLAESRRGSTGT